MSFGETPSGHVPRGLPEYDVRNKELSNFCNVDNKGRNGHFPVKYGIIIIVRRREHRPKF